MKKKIAIGIVAGLAILIVIVYGITRWYGRNSLLSQDGNPFAWVVETWDDQPVVTYDGVDYAYRGDYINILCIGVDKEGGMDGPDDSGNSRGQSDAIFLVSLDTVEKKIRVISVPRDTMVTLQCYDLNGEPSGSQEGQLALQYAYGDGLLQSAQLVTDRVWELLGAIPIHGFAALNLDCIVPINDAVGGVDVTMDQDYTMLDPAFVEGATVHLEGERVVHFVRTRDTEIPESAYTRLARQKQYLTAFAEQAKRAVKKDMTIPAKLLEELNSYIQMSMNAAQVTYLATEALGYDFSMDDMYVLTGEIKNETGLEEFYPDRDALLQLELALFYEEAEKK